MINIKIKFCEENKGKKKVINMIKENYPDIEISKKKCLGKCKQCSEQPIAMMKDKLIKGKDSEELYEKIQKEL
jgi:uncharacterized protein YuzB (UPF0349 family)